MTSKKWFGFLLGAVFILASCSPRIQPTTEPVQEGTITADLSPTAAVPLPTATATQPPPRSLVVCLEQEPASLYLYSSGSRSTWSVLEAVYDGPFDVIGYQPQPVILEKLPSYADGDALIQPVTVTLGSQVVDIHGILVTLAAGAQVLPSGCTSLDCAITWDGVSALQMDQAVVNFTLKSDIKWSDGAPLTADDSIYSYRLAADKSTPGSHQLVFRTLQYTALDAAHIQWLGVPGFFPERLDTIFWSPLPQHAWGNIPPAELPTNEISSRYPIGWGAYVIEEWQAGDHIRLKKNPLYFRSAGGLPLFDDLVFRFLGEAGDSLLTALQSKECDVIDQSASLESKLGEILALENQGVLQTHISLGPEWEQLIFGIDNADYDDGYSAFSGDRPDFFSDVRIRQAFAWCIDRQKIVDELLNGLSYPPSTYLPDTHPMLGSDVPLYAYDPQQGRLLLDQAGWKDWDGDPATPLQAVGNLTIPDGTFFRIEYVTSQASLRQQIAGVIQESLGECGVEVNVRILSPEELYAPGPDGVLFGKHFDLAQFAWSAGVIPPCQFYASSQIPDAGNNWLTLNIGGYENSQYDRACAASLAVRSDQVDNYISLQQEAQRIFAQELPSIPLYYRLKVALARPDTCGLSADASSRSLFWNLEELDYGVKCTP